MLSAHTRPRTQALEYECSLQLDLRSQSQSETQAISLSLSLSLFLSGTTVTDIHEEPVRRAWWLLPLPLATFYMERYWDEAFQRPAKFPPICLLSTGAAQGGDYPEPDAEGPSVAQAKEDEDLAQYGGRDLYLSPVLATPYLFLDFQNVRDEEEDDNDGLLSRSAPESRR